VPQKDLERGCACDFVISQFFELRADGYHNARADRQLVIQKEQHERLSEGARKTNAKRWGKLSPSARISKAKAKYQNQREEKNPAAKPAPPPDPRHKSFFDFAYEAFRMKYLQPPTWGGKHCKGLQLFLASHPQITQDEWQRRYENFLASSDQLHQKQRGSLLYFVGNFDQFIERTSSNGNKKTSADQRTRENLAAAGLLN
jgi:hypothetical protein